MVYRILLSPLARQEILETADYIQEMSDAGRAAAWKNALLKSIAVLDDMPYRCLIADESSDVGVELRELHFRTHRIIFTIDESEQTVQILRVYHYARAPLQVEDLE
jgi:plasmid stabilization system protein ParE